MRAISGKQRWLGAIAALPVYAFTRLVFCVPVAVADTPSVSPTSISAAPEVRVTVSGSLFSGPPSSAATASAPPASTSPLPAASSSLGRLKRYILRDCSRAEAEFNKAAKEDHPEILRYLGEVFRLNLASKFEAPLVAGNLANPADIWLSLSGESDMESKRCALKLAQLSGPEALNTLASAVALIGRETTPPELEAETVRAIASLAAQTPIVTDASDLLDLRRELRILARLDSRAQARREAEESSDTETIATALRILIFLLDESVLAPVPVRSVTPSDQLKRINVKEQRAIFRALSAADGEKRKAAIASLQHGDLKALEGFRVTASRVERNGAALALARLGGRWLLEPQTTKALDCGFVASFLPLTAPEDKKRRVDFENLVARCLLVGKEEFIWQVVETPELAESAIIRAVYSGAASGRNVLTLPNKLAVVIDRIEGRVPTALADAED
jgi:hypothetical protein